MWINVFTVGIVWYCLHITGASNESLMIKLRKNISLDEKTYDVLRKIAFKRKMSVSGLIRELLIVYTQGAVIKKNLTST